MKKMSFSDMLTFTAYWFSFNFLWGAMLTVIIPSQVKYIVGNDEKSAVLGTVLSLGAIVSMIVAPVVGALSDRSRMKLGRRRPYMIVGSLLALIPLYMMAVTDNMYTYFIGYLLLQFFFNLGGSTYQGLLPDIIPESQRGVAASFMGAMSFFGTITAVLLTGGLADSHNYIPIYWMIAAVIAVCTMITVFAVKEEQQKHVEEFQLVKFIKHFYVNPKQHADFIWVIISAFFILLGFYSIFNFLQYYLEDVLGSLQPAKDVTLVSAIVLVGATIISIFAGPLSDKIGRKKVVAFSALSMGITVVIMILAPSFEVLLFSSLFFGIGYGAFTSVQWALVTDTLPNKDASAKDLGIWHLSIVLPQVLGPKIASVLIMTFGIANLGAGYKLLNGIVILYLLIGAITIFKIKKVR